MRWEVIGLNEAEQSFRAQYGAQPWFIDVMADHKQSCLRVKVRDGDIHPGPPPGIDWKHEGFPVWFEPVR